VLYQISPRAAVHETAQALADGAVSLITVLGRTVGCGPGGRRP
jgi:hypothetical protein